MFRDRSEAGARLAAALRRHQGAATIVLGIPRGGVVVAAEVARRLGAELDVVVARKIGAPGNPELAIGAVTADGVRFLNDAILEDAGADTAYLAREGERKRAEAREREARFRRGRPAPRVEGRTVIVVDDGLATGATMRAAVRSVRRARPSRLIAAVPVGAPDSCEALRPEVDELVCLDEPPFFSAVGQFYRDFPQVSDEEAASLLQRPSEAAGP